MGAAIAIAARRSPRRAVIRLGHVCMTECPGGCRCFHLAELAVVIQGDGESRIDTPPYHQDCDCLIEAVD